MSKRSRTQPFAREPSDSRNSLQSLLRRMIEEAHQDLQAFVTGESFVKIAIRFFSLDKIAKFLCRFVHDENINLAAVLSERI